MNELETKKLTDDVLAVIDGQSLFECQSVLNKASKIIEVLLTSTAQKTPLSLSEAQAIPAIRLIL
jgi:hypothetical protein